MCNHISLNMFLSSILICVALTGCTPQGDPAISARGFQDDFERNELGEAWFNTGGSYVIRDGMLHVHGARNRPLWLRKSLPANVRIEFSARSDSKDGDIKFEVFGDGSSKATSDEYVASGYVIIFGGWHNKLNIIARMYEHGADRKIGKAKPVETGKTYRMKFERQNATLRFWVDDMLVTEMVDSNPLRGRGQDHFAFNDWDAQVTFDNLVIKPL